MAAIGYYLIYVAQLLHRKFYCIVDDCMLTAVTAYNHAAFYALHVYTHSLTHCCA